MRTLRFYPFKPMDTPCRAGFAVFMRILIVIAITTTPASSIAIESDRLVVLPFEIVDNTPVPGGVERNEKLLDKLTKFISQRISEEGFFDVVPQPEVNSTVNHARLGTYIHTCNQCEYDLAKKLDGDKVMIGWIYKMSVLVLTMHIEVKDVESEKTLISKAYDFRGDNEKAWLRAAKYMLRDLGNMVKLWNTGIMEKS